MVQIANKIPTSVRLTEIKTLPPPRTAKAYVAFDARQTLLLVGVASAQAEIDGVTLLSIQPQEVVVKRGKEQYKLSLWEQGRGIQLK